MSRMPTTNGARRTRERVLSAALELFNENGSASVTTNHVAARAGISPGNLYYWFSDKNQIVRELYAQFVAAYERLWRASHSGTGNPETADPGDPLDLTPDEVLARLADGAALSRRYAFLARDLLGLLHGDPALAAEYGAVRERRIAEFTGLARSWRRRGLIRPLDDGTVSDLVQALWVIAETWLAFGELDGSHPDAEHGTRLLRVVLQPYLTPEGKSVAAPEGESVATS
jgi:AcrR family transcriptional regulator